MGYLAPLLGAGLGCANVHEPVHLPAIGVDDLSLKPAGQGQRQPRFAHGGGADDEEEGTCGQGHIERERDG